MKYTYKRMLASPFFQGTDHLKVRVFSALPLAESSQSLFLLQYRIVKHGECIVLICPVVKMMLLCLALTKV